MYDKIFIAAVLVCSFALYGSFQWLATQTDDGKKIAVVTYRDKEVLRIDLSIDSKYKVNGTNGDVEIEVKDGKIRVEKENSPYNICSIQGWVSSTITPIVCLPNHVVIVIKSNEEHGGDDTVVH